MAPFIEVTKDAWRRWEEHGDLLAAAIAFYTLLSFAPVMVIAVAVVGLVYDPDLARGQLLSRLRELSNDEMATTVMKLMDAVEPGSGKLATVVAGVLLLWAAGRVFMQLQLALNLMWGVQVAGAASARELLHRLAYKRVISFAMVLGCGALLLATLLLQTAFSAVGGLLERVAAHLFDTGRVSSALLTAQQAMLSLALLTALFAMIYRVLPDVRIHWSDVGAGAALTAVLVLAGTWVLGFFLSRIAPQWLQGAVGSIAAFMLWTYYLAQVFLLGAAFTRAWAGRTGARVQPEPYARLSSSQVV